MKVVHRFLQKLHTAVAAKVVTSKSALRLISCFWCWARSHAIILPFFWLTSVFYASGCGYWDETQMVWSRLYEEWMEKLESFLQCLVSSRLGHFSDLVCFVSVDLLSSWKEKRRRKKERKDRQRYLWIDLGKWVWIRIYFDENVNPKDTSTAKERVFVYTTCNILQCATSFPGSLILAPRETLGTRLTMRVTVNFIETINNKIVEKN